MSKKRVIKPKHSLDTNRSNGSRNKKGHRSAATIRRLKMYQTRPKRSTDGKIISVEYGSKDLPCTRIQPDRRFFVPTRVVGQKQLEYFREECESRMSNNYNVILRQNKLPMSLLKNLLKEKRARRDYQPFGVNVHHVEATDCQALLQKTVTSRATFEHRLSVKPYTEDGFGASTRDTMFEKGELHKVIESSDVLIQVLDARDPHGTRCYRLEKYFKENCKPKHMILLLNKCDLIPTPATKGWIGVLSKEYPTLAFHANITKPFGKDSLLCVLSHFANLKGDKQAISVGLVGYPNVGKSSVINTLQPKNVFKVAPTPGVCNIPQYLTDRIFLNDCPGVIYPDSDSKTTIVLKGMVRVESLQDATEQIREVLKRVKKEHLERAYKIKDWEDETDFLVKLCNLTGNLKGGEPDLVTAAKTFLNDLQSGKIPFFVPPPKHDNVASDEQKTFA